MGTLVKLSNEYKMSKMHPTLHYKFKHKQWRALKFGLSFIQTLYEKKTNHEGGNSFG